MNVMLRCGDKALDLSKPRVMGILNTTPDSFSDGGRLMSGGRLDVGVALKHAEMMVRCGADILDIGGESTRPGASPVELQEEMDRVLPLVEKVHAELDVIVSVDTSSGALITEAARFGAGLINDVRSLTREGALEAAAATGLPVCIMHMPGEPGQMQSMTEYSRPIISVVKEFLLERGDALNRAGIPPGQVLIDPGFGFGKTLEQNLSLARALPDMAKWGFPLLIGLSRKKMIGMITGKEVTDRASGSVAAALLLAQSGARILRVHDVRETVDALKVLEAFAPLSIVD